MHDPWGVETDDDLPAYRPSREDPGSPRWMLILAAVAVVLSAAFTALGSGVGVNAAGYALASVVAATLVALFRRFAVRRFALAGVPATTAEEIAAVGLLVIGCVLAVLHAYLIARHYA